MSLALSSFPSRPQPLAHGYYSRCANCRYTPCGHVFCSSIYESRITKGETLNNQLSNLHRLPPELAILVLEHLSPAELASLKFACRLFYHNFSTSAALCNLNADDFFEISCLLERDSRSRDFLVCVSCKKWHPTSAFYKIDLSKSPRHRYCKRRKPVLQICPYVTLSFDEIAYKARQYKDVGCLHAACDNLHDHQSPQIYKNGSDCALHSYIFIAATFGESWLPRLEMDRHVERLGIPLCPHTRLHPQLYEDEADPLLCKTFSCRMCDSKFEFDLELLTWSKQHFFEEKFIYLSVERNLGLLEDVDDPLWLRQIEIAKQPSLQIQWVDRLSSALTSTLNHLEVMEKRDPRYHTSDEQFRRCLTDRIRNKKDEAELERKKMLCEVDCTHYSSDTAEIEDITLPIYDGSPYPDKTKYDSDGFLLSDPFYDPSMPIFQYRKA